MKKVKISILTILILILLSYIVRGQNMSIPILKFNIEELKDSVRLQQGGTSTYFKFSGSLIQCISSLNNINMAYVKTNDISPKKNISCEIEIGEKFNLESAKGIALNYLKIYYKFRIIKRKDNCEIWVITKTSTAKLVKVDFDKDTLCCGSGPMFENVQIWQSIGMPIGNLTNIIEWKSSNIVEEDEYDGEKYNFEVPYSIMNSYENLAKYLFDRYGLKLEKRRAIREIFFVEFL